MKLVSIFLPVTEGTRVRNKRGVSGEDLGGVFWPVRLSLWVRSWVLCWAAFWVDC